MQNLFYVFLVLIVACAAIKNQDDESVEQVVFEPVSFDTIIPINYDFSLSDTAVFFVQTVLDDSLYIVLDIEYDSESVPATTSSGILTKTEVLEELTRLRQRYVRQRQRFRQRANDARDKIVELDSARVQIQGN